MKKSVLFFLSVLMLAACGSKHQERTITVDEVPISDRIGNNFPHQVYPENHVLAQIFEVVPGSYTITTDKKEEGVSSGSDVNITLKLKLLKPVEVKELHDYDFGLFLLDADDNGITDDANVEIQKLTLGRYEWKSNGQYLVQNDEIRKDALPEFIEFLQSPVGTEAEITFGGTMPYDSANILGKISGLEFYINPGLATKTGNPGPATEEDALYQYHWKFKE